MRSGRSSQSFRVGHYHIKINLSRKRKIMIYVGIYNYSSVPYLQLFFLYNKLVSIILFTSSTCKMKLLFFFFFFLT